jgi:hypothetical protein
MPKIKLYTRLLPYHVLGEAELIIDDVHWDVSNMSFQDMMTIYEPEMRTAEKVVLSSSEVGTWKYQSRRWIKEG